MDKAEHGNNGSWYLLKTEKETLSMNVSFFLSLLLYQPPIFIFYNSDDRWQCKHLQKVNHNLLFLGKNIMINHQTIKIIHNNSFFKGLCITMYCYVFFSNQIAYLFVLILQD